MGLIDKILGGSGSPEKPEQKIRNSLSQVAKEIESLIQKVEQGDERLEALEENIKAEGSAADVNRVEQKFKDNMIYFQSGVQKIEEHVQRADVALNNVDLGPEFEKKARHNVQLAKKIVSYMEKELNEIDSSLESAEHSEGIEELNELERIEEKDEQVLERMEKMFRGSGPFEDNPDYGWLSLS
ncbi:hypothetical protein [Candidatus Nanohalococcus occultus]|uniref:hypothetical protein n=1 Tax=Candidatus Nanohalococcus occultus TaxID=2978047 RepID=UPI0039DFFA97